MRPFAERFPVLQARNSEQWLEDYLTVSARDDLDTHGAVLIRDTPIGDPQTLERFARHLIARPAEAYIGGVVPRDSYSPVVFSSTELTGLFRLKLHNEMAYQENYPRFISFFCSTAPAALGQTPIAHESDIFDALPEDLREKIRSESVIYVRRYLSRKFNEAKVKRLRSMFVPWQDAFKTESKAEVEKRCSEIGAEYSWDADDILTVRTELPTTRPHPATGKDVYFNQLLTQNFSVKGLGPAGYLLHRAMGIKKSTAPRHSVLARSGELTGSELRAFDRAYNKATTAFRWKERDWLLVDNLQAMHARNRFIGTRAIWVVMGD
ncbi:MAG: TauD/TfdA family dioxygenase [Rhodococcus sp. (in: high G+C Gram-positive bacteria)]|jgi:alpha-ketoglutarate-dependent taurine dioxygenase|uniref:TauD/TfdA family dioxygenase n=1 Tax=Nocardiaceae TaxID=85025 RepID=UPI001E5C13B6|nr:MULTISPECIES: TauD/TfdA family dioxygenase [Rhodococcus]MCZ4278986.1 TauD/TfdA family dioxygenase [Rhodococcus yunnanensis]